LEWQTGRKHNGAKKNVEEFHAWMNPSEDAPAAKSRPGPNRRKLIERLDGGRTRQ